MIIVLIGYMGSGKSSVGKELATILNYSFLDLDNYIEDQENASISEIFKNKGELYFRKVESKYLQELLDRSNNLVLALGGGTPCYGNNIEKLQNQKNVNTVFLQISIPHLVDRLLKEKDKRPLISHIETKADLQEFVGKHLFERMPFYSKAQNTVTTDNLTIKQVVKAILLKLF